MDKCNDMNECADEKTYGFSSYPEFILHEPIDSQLILENPETSVPDLKKAPKLIFIVPYRDRKQQQGFFFNHMKTILSDMQPSDYKIYFSEQCDNRDFNRGAMKNIGFLAMKAKYPNDYHNITFVFNDIDTMPYTKNFFDYETKPGIVKHFYGYKFTLGGIVCINGGDFERIMGFPNFWAWGFEDNMLQNRVLAANIKIDRSHFYNIMDPNVIQLKDGLVRSVNRGEFDRYIANTNEGIQTIHDLQYTLDEENGFIHVTKFSTGVVNNKDMNIDYDLRNGNKPFVTSVKRGRRLAQMGMII